MVQEILVWTPAYFERPPKPMGEQSGHSDFGQVGRGSDIVIGVMVLLDNKNFRRS